MQAGCVGLPNLGKIHLKFLDFYHLDQANPIKAIQNLAILHSYWHDVTKDQL